MIDYMAALCSRFSMVERHQTNKQTIQTCDVYDVTNNLLSMGRAPKINTLTSETMNVMDFIFYLDVADLKPQTMGIILNHPVTAAAFSLLNLYNYYLLPVESIDPAYLQRRNTITATNYNFLHS